MEVSHSTALCLVMEKNWFNLIWIKKIKGKGQFVSNMFFNIAPHGGGEGRVISYISYFSTTKIQ
jgi:hypothetical protein